MLPSGNDTDASYSPTFNSYFNVSLAETAARVTTEFADAESSDDFSAGKDVRNDDERDNGGDPDISCEDDSSGEDDDFEFDLSNLIPENGEIRPVYPVFNKDLLKDFHLVGEMESRPAVECSRAQVQLRNLFLEDHEYGGDLDLEDTPLESYCVWVPKERPVASPSPGRCTKSNSTGSSATKGKAKAWKLRDLLKRSKSDGKEGLVLLTPKKKAEAPVVRRSTSAAWSDGSVRKPTRVKASAREGYYGGGRNREGVECRRRSYLPYKQDLVGFFASPQSHRKIHLPPF